MKQEKKKKLPRALLTIMILVLLIFMIDYGFYSFFIQPTLPVKHMQDYTWQQVAFVGVLLFGLGNILRAFTPKIIISHGGKNES